MSGTTTSNDPTSAANTDTSGTNGTAGSGGAAVGGGGSGATSAGGSTLGLNLPELPPQYSTGNEGFPTRSTESVPTDVTVGPDGALYVSAYTGLPYGQGYSYIARIANPTATTGYDGKTPSGVPQTYASGFTEVQSVGFNNSTGNMFVLEYLNGNQVYDPTLNPNDLPPSALILVKPDGTRETINGPELHLANKLLVDQKTGDVFVSIDNDGPATATTPGTGEVLRYHQDPASGTWTSSVAASGLNNPTGMSFGPDGNLYVLEAGTGSPAGTPGADTAPVVPFIPGLVSERPGFTGSITRVDLDGGGVPTGTQETVLTGLASFREFNPTTGQDRVVSIGQNGMTIAPDGTVYLAAGGGLAPETAVATAPYSDELQGVLKVTGLFGPDPSQATVTPEFNTLTEADTQSPDGAITLFNTESNANGITVGADGKVYVVDAARNDVYGLTNNASTLDSVTVLQKQPPILTPPQYAGAIAYGGDPTAQYQAEISSYTTKDANNTPNVPGNLPASVVSQAQAAAAAAGAGGLFGPGGNTSSSGSSTSSPSGTDPTTGATSDGSSSVAPHGEDTQGSGVTGATSTSTSSGSSGPGGSASSGPSVLPPVPVDPVAPPVLANNLYTPYYNPFFGNFAPAPSDPLALPSDGGTTESSAGPATSLSMLTPGESWSWSLKGQFTPPGGGQAVPLSGTQNEDVEVLPFQGGTSLAFVSTQNLTLPDGTPLFGSQPPPKAIFYFNQDPTTGTVYVTGDNQSPDGSTRIPENPIVFIPGQWSPTTSYDNPLVFSSGESEDISLNVTGATSVTTPLGTFNAWVAPTNAVDSTGVSHPGTDYWTPELGAPAAFTTGTQLPDGSSISIAGAMTATTEPFSSSAYTVSKLVVFGDRLSDNGNAYNLAKSLGQGPDYGQAPYSPTGNFSDGPNWTTVLAQYLGATSPSQQENFAFESATARATGVPNPIDLNANVTPLDTFAGQIAQFEKQDGSFSPNDLVSVTFGGNDISLPSTESPEQGVTDSVNAIISGLQQLANDGAKHFLVSNLADVTLAPLFSNPDFLAATGATQAGFQGLVNDFNTQLASGLTTFENKTGLDVKTLDLHALFNGIANDPSAYGFTNITQPVLITPPGSSVTPVYNPAIVGQDPAVEHGSLFLDPYFDPTALGQAIIAQTARSTLTA